MAPFPHPLTIVFALIAAIGTIYVIFKPTSDITTNRNTKLAQAVIGHDIQNSSPGVGQEIVNAGSGIGGQVTVVAPAGASVIGTRVIQSAPGVGLRVINSGSGTGFRSTVVVGPKE